MATGPVIPPPPPGFQLDAQQGASSPPPPPPGFVLDSQAQTGVNNAQLSQKTGFLGGAAQEVGSMIKGAATPAVVQPVMQGIESMEAIPPTFKAYEQARQSGKGIVDSALAAQEVAKQHDQTLQGLKARVKEFETNPSAATGRAIVDAIAIIAPMAVKGLGGLKAPEADAGAEVEGLPKEAPAPQAAGEAIKSSMKATREAAGAKVGEAKQAAYPAGTGVTVGADSKLAQTAQQVLDETKGGEGFESLKTPETETVRNLAQEILDKTQKGMRLDPDTVSKLTKQLDDKINSPSLQGSDIGRYKLIKKALSDSEQEAISQSQGPEAAQKLGETKKEYAQIAKRQERGMSKAATRTQAPEKIITKIAGGGAQNQSEVESIMKDLDPAAKRDFQNSVIKQIAEKYTEHKPNGKSNVDWEKFNEDLTKKGQLTKSLLGERYDKIMGEIRSNVIKQRRLSKVARGAKTAVEVGPYVVGGGYVGFRLIRDILR